MGGVRRILGREKTEREKILKTKDLLSKQSCIYAFVVHKISKLLSMNMYIHLSYVTEMFVDISRSQYTTTSLLCCH